MENVEIRHKIISAGYKAINQLIKVAEEEIIDDSEEPEYDDEGMVAIAQKQSLSADRLKNAAATKKLCITDAFDILKRIEEEENDIKLSQSSADSKDLGDNGFAETRTRG